MMSALLRNAGRSLAAPARAPPAAANSTTTRSLYIRVREGHDPERVASRLHGVMNEDGIMRTLALKRFHEKKWQKRKRKVEEQTIRHANRKIGSMIDFILRRKKAGF
uniref:Ribosomal protein S21 n=1 Tax=Globisporangium ultimum (strain ATCC 200006 / CBS 805.95 / DAOM BR144) TaxID=431595 RepID=K3WJI4_GLOUD